MSDVCLWAALWEIASAVVGAQIIPDSGDSERVTIEYPSGLKTAWAWDGERWALQGVAARIVKAIEEDLNDRRGLHLYDLDSDTRQEIRRAWQRRIEKILDETKILDEAQGG